VASPSSSRNAPVPNAEQHKALHDDHFQQRSFKPNPIVPPPRHPYRTFKGKERDNAIQPTSELFIHPSSRSPPDTPPVVLPTASLGERAEPSRFSIPPPRLPRPMPPDVARLADGMPDFRALLRADMMSAKGGATLAQHRPSTSSRPIDTPRSAQSGARGRNEPAAGVKRVEGKLLIKKLPIDGHANEEMGEGTEDEDGSAADAKEASDADEEEIWDSEAEESSNAGAEISPGVWVKEEQSDSDSGSSSSALAPISLGRKTAGATAARKPIRSVQASRKRSAQAVERVDTVARLFEYIDRNPPEQSCEVGQPERHEAEVGRRPRKTPQKTKSRADVRRYGRLVQIVNGGLLRSDRSI
jgi:hypothetical protein